MKLSPKKFSTTVLACSLLVTNGHAGLILQDYTNLAGVMTSEWGFKGQSFTAEDPLIASIGIGVSVFNPQFTDYSITMSLYSGAGNAGPLLRTVTVDPGPGAGPHAVQWVDFSFPGLTLNPGSVYTFTYLASTTYWGGQFNQYAYPNGTPLHGTDYVGGQMFLDEGFRPLQDLRFRVVPVPEPSMYWIAAAGMSLFWFGRFGRRPR